MPRKKATSAVSAIRDRGKLAQFLLRKPALNAYPLGDLDPRYWPHTQWFALEEKGEMREIALLYSRLQPPILIAIPNTSPTTMAACLAEIQDGLPDHIYAHLGADLWQALDSYQLVGRPEPHHMMELHDRAAHRAITVDGVFALHENDFSEVLALFDAAYPGHWFQREMLSFGPYFAVRDAQGQLAAVGGVHVYSEQYKVAAIGNVVAHPDTRGQGLATQVSAQLVAELCKHVEIIGLNVHAENAAAIRVYEKLGFRIIADYFEMTLKRS